MNTRSNGLHRSGCTARGARCLAGIGKFTTEVGKFTMEVGKFTIKVGKFTMEVGEFTIEEHRTWKDGAVSNAVGERCGRLLERLQAPANSMRGDLICDDKNPFDSRRRDWVICNKKC